MTVAFSSRRSTPESIGAARAWVPDGVVETVPRWATGGSSQLLAGKLYAGRVRLTPRAYSTISIEIVGTAANSTTNAWLGVYDADTNARLVQVDITAALNAAPFYSTLSAALALTPSEETDAWLAIVIGGGTTMPALRTTHIDVNDAFWGTLAPAIGTSHSATGLTALPATLVPTVASNNRLFWKRYA